MKALLSSHERKHGMAWHADWFLFICMVGIINGAITHACYRLPDFVLARSLYLKEK